MSWKKGPLPPDTWQWGGVVPLPARGRHTGFYFADFCGDHVKVLQADGTFERLEPHEVAYYDNALTLPIPMAGAEAVQGRAGGDA